MVTKKIRVEARRGGPEYQLWLYVAGKTPKAQLALMNLQAICTEHLEGRYSIDVVDILENPKLAADHQILAVPAVIREVPEPIRKIIGTLADTERVLVGLDIRSIISLA